MGTWESINTVWTVPALGQATGLSGAVPNAKPGVAQWTRTIQAGDLTTCNRDVGWNQTFEVYASVLESGVSVGTLSAELVKNGVAVDSTSDAGHASGDRGNVTLCASDVVAGDVLELRLWATTAGGVLEWVGWRSCPSRLFKSAPPAGGRWLFRNIVVNGQNSVPAPTALGGGAPAWTTSRQSHYAKSAGSSDGLTLGTPEVVQFNSTAVGLFVARSDKAIAPSPVGIVIDDPGNLPIVRYSGIPIDVTLERLAIPNLLT